MIFFQLSFLLVYDLWLKKETFFSYNRWYLLFTPVIALLLPLLKFQALEELVPSESMIMLPGIYLGEGSEELQGVQNTQQTENGFQINWWWLIYSLGAFLNISLLIRKSLHLKKLFEHKVVNIQGTARIIEVPGTKLACTFFNTIFLGDQWNEAGKQQILSHELVHVRQKHSLDLVFFELLKIIFWFNPLVYIFQSKLAGLHEFIADAHVVKTTEKKIYYQQLLNTAFNTQNISFINQFFNHSLIKKRIIMLQKSRSRTISKFKFLILLPLMLGMLTYVSCSEDSGIGQEENKEIQSDESLKETEPQQIKEIPLTSSSQSKQNSDVPFAVIEEVPVFPGCEDHGTNDARKACMSEKITEHVNKNFDTSLGKELGLSGVNRIYVQFRINQDGNIEVLGARAPDPALEDEAKRTINSLPDMIPGKQRGQEVGVLYSLPITFKVGE